MDTSTQIINCSNDNLYTLYENLRITNKDITELDFLFYHHHQYEHKPKELKDKRIDQDKFRDLLIKRYNKCIITGNGDAVCEGCHIIPLSECNNYDIDNGLLLDNSIHTLFDKYLLTIYHKTSQIMIKEKILKNDNYVNFTKYNGMKIENLNQNTLNNLKLHNEKYFENNNN